MDAVGSLVRSVREQQREPFARVDITKHMPDVEKAWQEAKAEEPTLEEMTEAALRTAIRNGQSSEALNFHVLLVNVKNANKDVPHG